MHTEDIRWAWIPSDPRLRTGQYGPRSLGSDGTTGPSEGCFSGWLLALSVKMEPLGGCNWTWRPSTLGSRNTLAPPGWVKDSIFLSAWFRQVRNALSLGPAHGFQLQGKERQKRKKGERDSHALAI